MNVCGTCSQTFETEESYLQHTCTTGFNPTQPEHLGTDFLQIQKAALERGKERADADPAKQEAAIAEVDTKIKEKQTEAIAKKEKDNPPTPPINTYTPNL